MHGELDNVYATLQHLEKAENIKIDLLICCGDFQVLLYVLCFLLFESRCLKIIDERFLLAGG